MPKFDITGIVNDINKAFVNTDSKVSVASSLKGVSEDNFLLMPEWWVKATQGVPGLPLGKIVVIAGDSDSGKTSTAIEAMLAAQKQDYITVYVETENKTTKEDLEQRGLDTNDIIVIQESIIEEVDKKLFKTLDVIADKYPDAKILLVVDSFGNVVSQRDAAIDLTEQSSKPGGKGQVNRIILSKIVARRRLNDMAVLILSYTYDNIGSPGKTTAGGKSMNFFSSLTFQTTRKGWIEKQVKGQKVRVGAEVVWKLFKNHLNRSAPKSKEAIIRITSDGMECVSE